MPLSEYFTAQSMLVHPVFSIMGILNATPDSFSDGGRFITVAAAIDRVALMIAQGADIIDVGGESTRPNAQPVLEAEELDRVVPIVEAITTRFDCVVSVDTSTPNVFAASHQVGARLWNDVRALRRVGAKELAAKLAVPVVIMHMRGEPASMNTQAVYTHLVAEVMQDLTQWVDEALQEGVLAENIIIDPGFGFAKTTDHNLALLRSLPTFQTMPYPLMVGLSRKRFLGDVLGGVSAPLDRVDVGLAAAQYAAMHGVSVIRTHDVKPTADMRALLAHV